MSRKFIASVAAAALVITSFGAVPARAGSDEDIARILGGLIAITAVGAALGAFDDDDDRPRATVRNSEPPRAHRPYEAPLGYDRPRRDNGWHGHAGRGDDRGHGRWDGRGHGRDRFAPLPTGCLKEFRTRKDRIQGFGQLCLNRHYRDVRALPGVCAVPVRVSRRSAVAYSARCLRDKGFVLARR
jgi:hypothetical protein